MKIRTLLLLIALIAIGAFAALNWPTFLAPTTLSLGVTTVQAPLGLVMLGILVSLVALFLVYAVALQAEVLMDTRRHARELQLNRELADQAEASRLTELRAFFESHATRQAEAEAASRAQILARLEQLERDVRVALDESGNSLSAHLGELEDRLERGVPPLRPITHN